MRRAGGYARVVGQPEVQLEINRQKRNGNLDRGFYRRDAVTSQKKKASHAPAARARADTVLANRSV